MMCTECVVSYRRQTRDNAEETDDQVAKWQWFDKKVSRHMIPTTIWHQRPHGPEPFYVSVGTNTSDAEKLAWIRQDIGDCGSLDEFATKYEQLFPLRRKPGFRQAVLFLFRQYDPESEGAVLKEHELDPLTLTIFRRVFDPDTEQMCLHCGRSVTNGSDVREAVTCGRPDCVKSQHSLVDYLCVKCDATLDSEHPYCDTCKIGVPNTKRYQKFRWYQKLILHGAFRVKQRRTEQLWKRRRRS